MCTNTGGSYICSCPPDYTLANDTLQCIAPKIPLKDCSATLTNASGVIVFNNDQLYKDCVWTIKLPDQSKLVRLSIDKLDMAGADCDTCGVKVFNGDSSVNGTLVGQYCQTGVVIDSAYNEMTILHKPSECGNSSFELSYVTANNERG